MKASFVLISFRGYRISDTLTERTEDWYHPEPLLSGPIEDAAAVVYGREVHGSCQPALFGAEGLLAPAIRTQTYWVCARGV